MLSTSGIPVRLLLVPATLAAAGVVAVSPASGPTSAMAAVTPVVSVDDIRLTGIGQDIYYAITPYVQTAVGGVSYLINFLPLGDLIAAQINIDYYQGIQPFVEATVNYLAAVVQNPFDFLAATSAYGSTVADIAYNWVSAQLEFLGFDPLPLLPSIGAATPPRPGAADSAPGRSSRAGETGISAAVRAEVAPTSSSRRERGRATRVDPETRQSRQSEGDSPRSTRFGRVQRQAVPSLRPAGQAPLAQSAERFHGKEKVNGSIPLGGSVDAGPTGGAEDMAV